jgi:RimJ/RimL family protein N-acetyltransferase
MAYELVKLGVNPVFEAEVLKRLYTSDAVDVAVINEFDATVAAYRDLDIEEIKDRLAIKYGGENPQAIGLIALDANNPVGMAIAGQKSYLSFGGEVEGVNISGWVSAQTRNLGIGKQGLSSCISVALNTWDLGIWTSIHRENIASQKVSEAAGFKRIHSQLDEGKGDRDIYLLGL